MLRLRFGLIALVVASSCAPRVEAPPPPAPPPSLIVDLVWPMFDWRADERCPKDPRGFIHVDLAKPAFTFAVCEGKASLMARTLDQREASAIRSLIQRLPHDVEPTTKSGCPLLRWREPDGEWQSGSVLCDPRRSSLVFNDVFELLAAMRTADEKTSCGGPLGRRCATDVACSNRNGLVPYAYGRCAESGGGITITCAAMALCPQGWKESTVDEDACSSAKRGCRWVSAGCNDERLCEQCGPTETCPGG